MSLRITKKTQKENEFIFPVPDGTAKFSGGDHEFREPTPRREQLVGSEDLSGELQGEQEEPQPTETKGDAEARKDSGRFKVTSSIVITSNLEFSSTCRKEESFPIPLKYIDMTRATYTNLDVLQEKRIDDCWNVGANRSLSDSSKGFRKFTVLNEKPRKGTNVLRGETCKDSSNCQTCLCVA